MKCINYIMMALVTISFYSCRIGNDNLDDLKRTVGGKLVYDNSAQILYNFLEELNMLQNMDLLLTETDPIKCDSIKSILFYKEEIQDLGNGVYSVKNSDRSWIITTDGNSLQKQGSSWTLSEGRTLGGVTIPKEGFVVNCVGVDKWELTIKKFMLYDKICDAELTCEIIDRQPNRQDINSNYLITGEGMITTINGEALNVNYVTEQPMKFVSSETINNFVEGVINFTVKGTEVGSDEIKATLMRSANQNFSVKIAMKEVTEIWNNFPFIRKIGW